MSDTDDIELTLENLREWVWRWQNHYKMLDQLNETNTDKKLIEQWRTQIDDCFREKIRSSL